MKFEFYPQRSCPKCQDFAILFKEEYTRQYLEGKKVQCPSCKNDIDWWEFILETIEDNFLLTEAVAPIGARNLLFDIILKYEEEYELDFQSYGLPENAKILAINYTPQGPYLFPIEIHGNYKFRFIIPHKIKLYPKPNKRDDFKPENKIAVMVTWIPQSEDDDSWANIILAFENYTMDPFGITKLNSIVIPANVAVESKLTKFVDTYLTTFISKSRVKDFLVNGATYSSQLNVILPIISKITSVKELPSHIRGQLNRLRDLRNELAHLGKLRSQLERKDAALLLSASLFGFHYLQILEDKLLNKAT